MSLQYIKNYNNQENKRFGVSQLLSHIDNYNTKNPFSVVLQIPKKGKSVTLPICNTQEWKKAKQFIIDFDPLTGNKKELIKNYVYYVTRRPKNDTLEMGRYLDDICPERDREIIRSIYDNKCVMCGSNWHLQIHHIEELYDKEHHYYDPVRRDIENQITVCKECHCKIHGFK